MFRQQPLTRRNALRSVASAAVGTGVATMVGKVGIADDAQSYRTAPRVPGTMELPIRRRRKQADGSFQVIHETAEWEASETAIIICDMWADHPCKMAAMRGSEIVAVPLTEATGELKVLNDEFKELVRLFSS